MANLTYFPNFIAPNVIKHHANLTKYQALNRRKFCYSVVFTSHFQERLAIYEKIFCEHSNNAVENLVLKALD